MTSRTPLPPADWLASIFASSHIAIGISQLDDGRFVAVNDAFERLSGYRRQDIIGRTALELGLWPRPEERQRLMEKLRRNEVVRAFEAGFRRHSGEVGDVQVSARIHDFDGRRYLVGLLTDITERKQAERASRLNASRLDVVLKLSELLVFHQDRQLRYTWVANPVFGDTADELVGRNDAEILGRKDARPLTAIKRRVLRSGKGERQEVWVRRNGQTGCFDLIVEPERGADGRVTGIVCAAVDITRRKQADQRLRLQADILDAIEEAVNLSDARGILLYTNRKFASMFGYADGELIGQHASILNAPGESTPEATAAQILRALERDGHWHGELKNRRKDGSEFRTFAKIIATHHPVFGKVWASVQSDVTALRQTQAERDQAQRLLYRLADHVQDEIEAHRRELAREVHDEIGATPTGIRMRLEQLASRRPADELGEVRTLVDHALETTRAVCSRLRPPMLDDLGLAETLRWYVRDWSRLSGIRAGIRIVGLHPDPADPLRTDLFRMLQELLTNVARHSGAGRVAVSLTRSRDALRLRVSDDGQGFVPQRGEGFGLSGIRERLRRYGGTMAVASGPGAAVTLRIPEKAP